MRKSLFLSLSITCFVALVILIILGGYLGVFDTLAITSDTFTRILTTDELNRSYRDHPPLVRASWGERIELTYEIENRDFSPYQASVEVEVFSDRQVESWLLFSRDIVIESFQREKFEWTVNFADLIKGGFTEGQYTLKIVRGGVRRVLPLGYLPFPLKPLKPPPPTPVPALQ